MSAQHSTTTDFSSRYKFNGKELDQETGCYYGVYPEIFWRARYYNLSVSRWLSVDPLAEKYTSFSPYNFTLNNPVRLVDFDGRSVDNWIKNLKTGEYIWDEFVNNESETPLGYRYIGNDDNDIIIDLFGEDTFIDLTSDIGLIASEDYDNKFSSFGVALFNMNVDSSMMTRIYPNIKYEGNERCFEGVTFFVTISGNYIAPYPDTNINLLPIDMNINGMELKINNHNYISIGSNVKSLDYYKTMNSNFIYQSYQNKFSIDINFKGLYFNGEKPLSYFGAFGALGIPNYTQLNQRIFYKNF